MRKYCSVLFIVVCILFTSIASAKICSGNIQEIRTWQNGGDWLGVNIGYGMWLLCKTSVQTGTVSPDMCKSELSLLMTAFSLGKKVNIDIGTNYTDCATVPTWSQINLVMTFITK